MDFEQAYGRLNAEQREAVDYIDGPLLVIAGPGTGKTQLLSMRVANILKITDTAPENILCLTFTETGARNMRERLGSLLGVEGQKVNVSTYHAFGSVILQGERPDLTTATDELEQFTIIRAIQKKLKHDDILKAERHTKDIISTISDVKSALLTPADLRKIAERNIIDVAKINTALEGLINSVPPRSKWEVALGIYEQILECLLTFVNKNPAAGKVEPLANIYAVSLGEVIREESAKDRPSVSPFTKWRAKYFSKDENDKWVLDNYVANKKLLSISNIMGEYERILADAGKFDYDDMILSAIKLLEENPEVKYNAQEHYQYILLDEFQDTNDAQARLVQLLTDNPANGGRPNIMAVGDDDQAIYGFQGAQSSNFLDFDAAYHPKIVALKKNYRSGAPILELAGEVIAQADDRFSVAAKIDKNISAERKADTTIMHRQEFRTAVAEYAWLGANIRRLLDEGVPGNEIAVIAPKHKYLQSILPFLRHNNIPVSYQKRENILDDAQISELVAMCGLVLALAKDLRRADAGWFRVLSFDCWGLGVKEIVDEIAAAKTRKVSVAEQLLASKSERVLGVAEFVVKLAGKVQDFSAEYIISEIIAKCFKDADNYDLLTNLAVLRDLARSKTKGANEKLLLGDFMEMLSAYRAAEIPILNKSPYHETDAAVQLMTVHSAKGLEFEQVFLVATDDQNWGNAKGNTNKLSLPRNMEFVRHTGDSLDEKVRVFFVAITRAKSHLYMTSSVSDFLGRTVSRLKFLEAVNQEYAKVIQEEDEIISPEELSLDWFSRFKPSAETEKELLRPLVENYKISPTHLNDYIDLNYAGPEEFLRRHIYRLPQEGGFSLSYGTIIHEVMQEMVDEKADDARLLEIFATKVAEADAEDDEKAELLEQGRDNLSAYLKERGDILRQASAVAEKAFYAENIMLGATPLTGKIDRIEIDEAGKSITVVDFKTGAPKQKWTTTDATLKYKLQLYFYKFLLENSREYKNYKVTTGRIEFVKPGEKGEVIALELEFNDKDAGWIRQLIEAVYGRVKALDFPSTEEFGKSSKAFIDYLIS
jgi:DNA helicase-2/ATP-dependent DNA helicase PcrA